MEVSWIMTGKPSNMEWKFVGDAAMGATRHLTLLLRGMHLRVQFTRISAWVAPGHTKFKWLCFFLKYVKETQLSLINRATHLCRWPKTPHPHLCYHVKFGSSASKGVCRNRSEPQNSGALWPAPCGRGIADPYKYASPQLASRKSQIFPTPCILRPRWRSFHWNWVPALGVKKNRMT